MWMWGHRLPGDPGTAFAGHLHSFVAGKGFGSYSDTHDKQADALVLDLNAAMDLPGAKPRRRKPPGTRMTTCSAAYINLSSGDHIRMAGQGRLSSVAERNVNFQEIGLK